MAGSAFLQYSLVTCAQAQTLLEKGGAKDMNYGVSCRYFVRPGSRGSIKERSGTCLPLGIRRIWPSPYFKAFHAALAVAPERIASENDSQVQQEKENQTSAMFPDGFESLLMEVCDETDVAELKIKVGNFEMHMRRNINTTKGPLSIASPLTPPPVPSKPMVDSVPATAISAPSSPERKFSSPFITKLSSSKTSKFGLVEAAGDEGLLLVTSPKVGLFRRGRVVKGKSGRPLCEEKWVSGGSLFGIGRPPICPNLWAHVYCNKGQPSYNDPCASNVIIKMCVSLLLPSTVYRHWNRGLAVEGYVAILAL